jgi:signal transduction histidine kinase
MDVTTGQADTNKRLAGAFCLLIGLLAGVAWLALIQMDAARAAQREYAAARQWMLCLSLLAVLSASAIAVFTIRALARESLKRRLAEQSFQKARGELVMAQTRLMEASSEAVAAEATTGVLHNINNVLNSIIVSNTIIREKLKESKFLKLGKVRGLLQEHQADLAAFLTTDPKGQLLPAFIVKLADNLDSELFLLQAEHEQLTRNIEHIKEIVAMQQMYAQVSGSREKLSIATLVESALQMNGDSFACRGIQIVRDYSDVPPVTVDRHKVLQILFNLITNAKLALEESRRPDPQVHLKIGLNGNNCVKVAVSDNGVGIAAENFPRIFSYGFTTRKNGHGFGLHSAINTAREMGGQLTAHSEGAGKGATFVLEIPMDDPKHN